jgi:glycosyltransferase involved in cell wall biosynthesis
VNVLVLSFYYPPDLSAGSFRTSALVAALVQQLEGRGRIDVITTLPNRYRSFSQEAPEHSETEFVRVRRVRVSGHRSGMIDQSIAFLHYARAVLRNIRGRQYDVVYATSSRLLTAFLGAICARRLRAPLFLDIRDIFVDTIGDLLASRRGRALLPVLRAVERFTIKQAACVNLVSGGFRQYFAERYPAQRFSYLTNGVDDEFLGANFDKPAGRGGPRRILYAGNIGEGQGLHHIVPPLARRLGADYEICVVGDGGRRAALEQALAREAVSNVRLLAPVGREQLLTLYRDSDCLFLHLNDFSAFRKVLPSKIFEYAATGKPILAGVAGYAADFIRDNVDNAAVFAPCDVEGAMRAVASLRLTGTDRSAFVSRFRRSDIMRELARAVLATGRQDRGDAERVPESGG